MTTITASIQVELQRIRQGVKNATPPAQGKLVSNEALATLPGPIGILGGSFDPPHFGHIIAAGTLRNTLGLFSCLLVPTRKNPLKGGGAVADEIHRLKMLELAIADEPRLLVSPLELCGNKGEDSPISYTVDTLIKLRSLVGAKAKLYLLLGYELLPELHRWKDYERLEDLATLVPFQRGGFKSEEIWSRAARYLTEDLLQLLHTRTVQIPAIKLSSSDIRLKLRERASIKGLVPEGVNAYIKEHGLYS